MGPRQDKSVQTHIFLRAIYILAEVLVLLVDRLLLLLRAIDHEGLDRSGERCGTPSYRRCSSISSTLVESISSICPTDVLFFRV